MKNVSLRKTENSWRSVGEIFQRFGYAVRSNDILHAIEHAEKLHPIDEFPTTIGADKILRINPQIYESVCSYLEQIYARGEKQFLEGQT